MLKNRFFNVKNKENLYIFLNIIQLVEDVISILTTKYSGIFDLLKYFVDINLILI